MRARNWRSSLKLRIICLWWAVGIGSACAGAQQSPAPVQPAIPAQTQMPASAQSAPDAPSASQARKTEEEKQIEKEEQSRRVLGMYPQFAVTSRQKVSALTRGEKFHLFAKSAFDPFEFLIAGIQSGSDQAEGEFPEYGQGLKGFGKRYAADFGDSVSSGFWTDFFWPIVTREDPRYFRKGEGPFIHRLGYAFEQAVVCRSDKGNVTFNASNFLGAFSAGALSNIYHPQSDRGVGLTARGASIALAYGSIGQILNEFWPDVSAKIRRHRERKHQQAEPAPAQTPAGATPASTTPSGTTPRIP
jgi:hypothetical protein